MGRDTNWGKGSIISTEHNGTAVSIRSVVSKTDEPSYFKVTARPQTYIRNGSNGGEAEFASSGMSAQTVKIGHFVLPHSVGLACMRITALKTFRLRFTLNFSKSISAAVVALDHQVSVYLDRQSIVTEKHPLRQHLPIKGKHNSLGRFSDSGAIHHRLIVMTPNL
ncbi:hypothetical protein EVAR_47164_1 [Eumeta japonica]|uniref:Uncharacterized protein n=1 Tax=Eumeta variegata TaxID=151549 RepID=A0A4C1WVK3_EUMVA|nr:hypothetical protein EVAR_47164_1 [Eumeta japonica]